MKDIWRIDFLANRRKNNSPIVGKIIRLSSGKLCKIHVFLFETLCIRDLRVFADALNGEVYHYRDKDGQECNAVIHLRNGKYGLIEIKLGGDRLIEEGANSLKSMEAKIDTDKMNAPSFLMVLTGIGDYAYRRKDGVYVVPVGCLKN